MNTVYWEMSDRTHVLAPETGIVFITGEGTSEGLIVSFDGTAYTVGTYGARMSVKPEHIIGIGETEK